ncbi:hypothetical protein MMPV_007404 [Pyropia vietnamensis]
MAASSPYGGSHPAPPLPGRDDDGMGADDTAAGEDGTPLGSADYPIVLAEDVLTPLSSGVPAAVAGEDPRGGGTTATATATPATAAVAADTTTTATTTATTSSATASVAGASSLRDGEADGIFPQVSRILSSSEEEPDEDDEADDDDEDSAVRALSLRSEEDPDGDGRERVAGGGGDHSADPAASGGGGARPAVDDDDPAAWCIICFERAPNVELRPCDHANICLDCVVRLVKRRCPTCRARVRRIRITSADGLVSGVGQPADGVGAQNGGGGESAAAAVGVTLAAALGMPPTDAAGTVSLRELIAARKQREVAALDSTLQIVFVGPPSVGKKTLVRKLCAAWPLRPPAGTATAAAGAAGDGGGSAGGRRTLTADAAAAASDVGVNGNGDGTDFRPNVTLPGGVPARLTVLRRTLVTSRRMLLDDVRLLRPDALVLCCAAGDGCASFRELLSFDRVLRASIAAPRLWAVVDGGGALSMARGGFGAVPPAGGWSTLSSPRGGGDGGAHSGGSSPAGSASGSGGRSPVGTASVTSDATLRDYVGNALTAVTPLSVRPRGLYFVTPSAPFSMGIRTLVRDLVDHGRMGREAAVAAAAARANVGSVGRSGGGGGGGGAGVRNVQFRSVVSAEDGRVVAGVNRMLNWLVGDT